MSTPAIIWLCLTGLGLGVALAEDGKPKKGNHSFWLSLLSSAIGNTILYYGGFFK